MKKWMNTLIAGLLVLGIASPAWAASSFGKPSMRSTGSHSVPATSSGVSTPSSNTTKSSGVQRPSSSVTNPQTGNTSSTTTNQPTQAPYNAPSSKSKFGGVGSFLGGMAVGGLLGSMFHPFGGGMVAGGFSFMGLLFDIVILAAIVSIVRKLWRRRA